METTPLPPVSQETAPSMSLAGRLTNVYASPGEVFTQVRKEPASHANWVVPLLLSCLMVVVFSMVVFSQPSIIEQVKDEQAKKIQQMVESGRLTQERADQALQQSERFLSPTILKVSGSIGGLVAGSAWFFALGLGLWLLSSKIFKASTTYVQMLEVAGLANMIPLLGVIVSIFLVTATGSMLANLGPILLVKEIDPANKMHQVLASINLMTLWYLGVLSIGIAKTSGTSLAKAGAWIFGFWILLRASIILAGWGTSGM